MALFSSIGRRGRGRRRGRRFNAERNVNVRRASYATCTNYGQCYGQVIDYAGSNNPNNLSSAQTLSVTASGNNSAINFFDITVRNQPVPDIYLRSVIGIPYSGAAYKPNDFSGDWVPYPTKFSIVSTRRFRTRVSYYATLYDISIAVLPGHSDAESNYRIFTSRAPVSSAPLHLLSILSQRNNTVQASQLALRDFRGSAGPVSLNLLFARDPRQPYQNYGGAVGWYSGVRNAGYLRLPIPYLDDSVAVLFKLQ